MIRTWAVEIRYPPPHPPIQMDQNCGWLNVAKFTLICWLHRLIYFVIAISFLLRTLCSLYVVVSMQLVEE